MQKDEFQNLSDKIEKLNFYAFRERNILQKKMEAIAAESRNARRDTARLLHVVIVIEIFMTSLQFPAVAQFFAVLF